MACAVITTLNNWWSPCKNWTPGADNSNLIIIEKAVPIIPAKTANIRYKVPISLALVEKSHLTIFKYGLNFKFWHLLILSVINKNNGIEVSRTPKVLP